MILIALFEHKNKEGILCHPDDELEFLSDNYYEYKEGHFYIVENTRTKKRFTIDSNLVREKEFENDDDFSLDDLDEDFEL